MVALCCGLCLLTWQPLNAQSQLSIEQIMQGPDFVGYLPTDVHWSDNGESILFSWNPESLPEEDYYQYNLTTGVTEKVDNPRVMSFADRGSYNSYRSAKVFASHGDLFLWNETSDSLYQLTNTVDRESQPFFLHDDQRITYIRDDNIYIWDQQTGFTKQITQFVDGNEPDEKKLDDQQQWLEDDQLELFDILRERKEDREFREKKDQAENPDRPRKIYIGKDRLSDQKLSPDGKFVTYELVTSESNNKRTMVPDFVTESGYLDELNARPKVGSASSKSSYWIYDVDRDTNYQVTFNGLPGIYDKPDYYRFYHRDSLAYVDTFETPREVMMHAPVYNEDGSLTVVVIRSSDNKDRWIMSLNLDDGDLTLIDRQSDTAWVGGPGIGGFNGSAGNIGWLGDNETLYFQSEETGFSHVYTYHVPTKTRKQLTDGAWEVLDVSLTPEKDAFYVHASREGPFENHFYLLDLDGSMEKITSAPGKHEVKVSPNGEQLAILHSYANRPTELYLKANQSGAPLVRITESTTEDFMAYEWRDPEIIHFTARDGVEVPARIYRPEESKSNGAGIIFVHGAGYLHNVHKWWSSYYREYMFHNFLTDMGYTVLDIDYRASAGYGRDWRTAIYRFMGGQDLDDQVDGARYLVEQEGLDADRLGIYGGSYGGFITLMALCTAPGTFKCGAALRSVTDWAHYNHGYTSNILNTPVTDSIAFRRSSPIYHAEGLEGELVMLHGMVDTNVQFQDVVRMSQRFIELGKDHWELAVFPMEGHGFVEPSSWADEYKRIYQLFEEQLTE